MVSVVSDVIKSTNSLLIPQIKKEYHREICCLEKEDGA